MIPDGCHSPASTLVIVDLSGWLHGAFHRVGVDGMAGAVAARWLELLAGPAPAFVLVALDSVSPTWRHKRTAALPGERRYKAHRVARPPEFHAISNRIIDLIELCGVPLLWCEGWEADDGIATAVRLAADDTRIADIVIATGDKDLAALVRRAGPDGPEVRVWHDGPAIGVDDVCDKFGVHPIMLRDWLAITGDTSDNVRGIDGIGPKGAAQLLHAYGSIDGCLSATPPTWDAAEIKRLEAAQGKIARLTREGKPHDDIAPVKLALDMARESRDLAGMLAKLAASREDLELARELVTLDDNAPIAWTPLRPLGGFDIAAVRKVYRDLGFGHGRIDEALSAYGPPEDM